MASVPRAQVPQPHRFYDGGSDTEPPDPARPFQIVVEREVERGAERFRMLRRIAYLDDEYGEILVPKDLATFRTDFASVPDLFTWLVPKTGNHLPPALIHDGLINPGGPATYISTDGHVIDRADADRVFRAGMRDSHVPLVRRWLVWSAVTLGTIWSGSAGWSRGTHLRYRLAMLGTLGVVVVLGVLATLDLADVVDWVPWMGDRPFLVELAGGGAGAVVIPLLLGLTWGRFRIAGVIAGIALALLLHVTVVLVGITLLYQVAEHLAQRRPLALLVATGTVVASCAVLTALLVGTR